MGGITSRISDNEIRHLETQMKSLQLDTSDQGTVGFKGALLGSTESHTAYLTAKLGLAVHDNKGRTLRTFGTWDEFRAADSGDGWRGLVNTIAVKLGWPQSHVTWLDI